jgi:hypothetical protein
MFQNSWLPELVICFVSLRNAGEYEEIIKLYSEPR